MEFLFVYVIWNSLGQIKMSDYSYEHNLGLLYVEFLTMFYPKSWLSFPSQKAIVFRRGVVMSCGSVNAN